MERHLVLLGLFYAAYNKPNQAESLYVQAIEKMEKEKRVCYSLMMAKNFYG
jgi:hypothetical protein